MQVIAVYVDGLVNTGEQNESFFRPLMFYEHKADKKADPIQVYEALKTNFITVGQISEYELWDSAKSVLSGDTVLLFEGVRKTLSVNTRDLPHRSVEDPKRETAVRGLQEGFTEHLRTNLALLRRRLKDPDLVFESRHGGTYTETEVAIVYLRSIADLKVVEEVRRRLERINYTDSILESGNIEELIEDNPYSPFPQIKNTERPDKAAAQLLEGRVLIMMDGTPFGPYSPDPFLAVYPGR